MTPDEPTGADVPHPGTSSVADEAARLAEAFAVWAHNGRQASSATLRDDAAAGGENRDASTDPSSKQARAVPQPGCDCAHGTAVEAVCRMCPVCRMAGIVQAVQPDLLDRVADLLGLMAGGLHSAAEQRRAAEDDTPPPATRDRQGTPWDGSRGMDVPVTGGDDD